VEDRVKKLVRILAKGDEEIFERTFWLLPLQPLAALIQLYAPLIRASKVVSMLFPSSVRNNYGGTQFIVFAFISFHTFVSFDTTKQRLIRHFRE
jgi:hypothetical protein